MAPEVVLTLGLAAILGITTLGLGVLVIGGKLRASRRKLKIDSKQNGD